LAVYEIPWRDIRFGVWFAVKAHKVTGCMFL